MTRQTIETKYWIGDVVYLRVRDEPLRGMVTSVVIYVGAIMYSVRFPSGTSDHYDYELTSEFVPDFAHSQPETN